MADFLINVIVNTQGAQQGVRNVDRSLSTIEQSLNRISRLVGAVFAFTAIGGAITSVTRLADTLLNAENRVRSLGIEGAALDGVIGDLFGVANRTRQEFSTTAEVFTRTAASLRILGIDAGEAVQITESLNQAVALSGSTTAEASNALIQFSQGLASGTLRGDELRSVLEQIPVVADVIAERLGVTRNELRQLAQDGTITPQVIVEAFRDAREELSERFAALIPTISQSFVVLRNRVIEVGGGFLQSSGAAEGFARAILATADNIDAVLRVIGALITALAVGLAGRAIPLVITGVNALTVALLRNPFTALAVAVSTAIGFLTAFADEIAVTEDGVTSLADVAGVAFDRFSAAISGVFTVLGTLVSETANIFAGFDVSFEDVLFASARFGDQLLAIFVFIRDGIDALLNDTINTLRRVGESIRDAVFGVDTPARQLVENIRASLRQLGTGLGEDAEETFGGAADQGTAEFIRRVALGNGPITEALRGVLIEAGANAAQDAENVGQQVGSSIFTGINQALAQERAAFTQALDGLLGTVSEFLGLSEQEFRNFAANIGTILGSVDLQGAFNNALTALAQLIGTTRSELVNALGGVFAILNELGISIEETFGEEAATAIRILGAVTSEQFQGILTVGRQVFGQLGGLISGLGPAFSGAVGAAQSFFSTVTAGGASASAALAPIAAVIAGIGAIVLGTLAIFGAFGDEVQRVATVLAAVFAPFIFSIQLIIRLVEFLVDLFGGLGDTGGTVGRILEIAFAPIVIPIRLIIEAVEFLIDLFSNLGDVGGTVGTLLSAVLAPIVIPIRLIIEAVEFLIELFGNLGGAGEVLGNILGGVFNGILAVGQAAFQGIQAVAQAVFGVLQNLGQAFLSAFQGIFNAFQGVATGVFNAIQGAFGAAFNAIQSLGQNVFNALGAAARTLQSVLGGVFSQILALGRNLFGGLLSVAQSTFSGIISAGQGLLSGLSGVFNGILGAFNRVFASISTTARNVFDGLIRGARGAVNTIGNLIGGIGGGIGDAFGGIGDFFGGGFRGVKKIFGGLFAKGAVIDGPVDLAGPGLAGKKFRRGGLLPTNTLLGNLQNVTGTNQLGLAGEAGPEGIFPLSRTSQGLGVRATFPESFFQNIRDSIRSAVREVQGSGTTIVNRVVLISAPSQTMEELEAEVADLGASIEQRVDVRLADVLSPALGAA